MKILEVKNNLVKISYTAQDNLLLSGFVIIEDSKSPYVAQIMSLKADSGVNYAIVKLLFTFNEEGVVKNYNGTIPELDASITSLSSNELLDILPVETPLKIGKLAQQNFLLNVDTSILEKNLLICSDKTENSDILISNFVKQITETNSKSVIFDSNATINAENTLVFGKDFKLPLNYDTINFIYENDLNDVNPTSKAIIQDVFLEVQEYSKTLIDQFIPFDNFLAVVESQYKALNIPELALLKSRLIKYRDDSVFAQNAKEIQVIRSAIRSNVSTLFDISSADDALKKLIINYIYEEIRAMDLFVYSFVKINSDSADKRLIRKFLSQDKISTTVVAPHNYKYLYELKDRASNLILFAPQTLQHDFAAYNIFLNKLNEDEAVIFGKATQNIPLIVEVMPVEDLSDSLISNEMPLDNESPIEQSEEEPQNTDFTAEDDSYSQESMLEDTGIEEEQINEVEADEVEEVVSEIEDIEGIEENEPQEEVTELEDQILPETLEPEISVEPEFEQVEDTISELPDFEEITGEEVPEFEESAEEPQELDYSQEYVEAELPDEFEEVQDKYLEQEPEFVQEEATFEELEFQSDESLNEVDVLQELDEFTESEEPQDNLTIDDLDFIEDVNTSTEDGYVEEVTQADDIPVFEAEELTAPSSSIVFEPGDSVTHPKYGDGVVEKMIKYGNKTLCSIKFENGRRLLDPTISEIHKL